MDKVINEHENAANEGEIKSESKTSSHDIRTLLANNKKLKTDKQALLDREKKQIE